MPNLNWSEVRDRAIAFSRKWADETSEASGKQTFWNEFFAIFGRERRTVSAFEVAVKNLAGAHNHIDLLWKGVLLVEHKSLGKNLDSAESQAFDYIADLAREGRHDEIPRYVILSDFQRFALFDLEPDERDALPAVDGKHVSKFEFSLADLHKNVRHFAFIKGERTMRLDPEDPANEKAYSLMCGLHDELEAVGFTGTDLERLLVRLLFCLFADDTEVFEPSTFETFVREQTREDGSDVGARLNQLFELLNKDESKWPATAKEDFAGFRYINGDLFRDRLDFPPFTRSTRQALLKACEFQWAKVSPAVFGSLFQGIMEAKERRQQGAHYTSERDIMKVIRSLFLDDLRAEFETIKADSRKANRAKRLEEFHNKLRSLRFLDPACGCGNFLVLGYRELRQLEVELLEVLHGKSSVQRVLNVRDLIQVDVDQFHGIEYAEWPTRIAEVAMWLMDHQMNKLASEKFGQSFERLPLQSSPHIVQGNALRIDWKEVLPPTDNVYVMGNPPFIGKQYRNSEQQADMEVIWGDVKGAGVLDYVTCWYRKAVDYILGTSIAVAFVSTNSITQGEQVGILWGELFKTPKLKIHFGHRTFSWASEARGKAHVHVVIVGFGLFEIPKKNIYEYDSQSGQVSVSTVTNISPFLIAGNDVVLLKRTTPICDVPPMNFGSMPNDGGHLLLETTEKQALLATEPDVEPYIRPFVGAEEFINGQERWCLWLVDIPAGLLRKLPSVMERVEAVKQHRQISKRTTTQSLAQYPTLFGEIRQPTTNFLLIPGVSSESRKYIPIGFLNSKVVASNLVNIVPGATLYHFGILCSRMHMAWVAQVCGRLKSDYRYSGQIVYNNFPWPQEVKPTIENNIKTAAQHVLDARASCGDGRHGYLPVKKKSTAATLADLYSPVSMPPALSKAHTALDRAVDRCYRSEPFKSDRERVEHLFAMYERLTAPLLPVGDKPPKKSLKANKPNAIKQRSEEHGKD